MVGDGEVLDVTAGVSGADGFGSHAAVDMAIALPPIIAASTIQVLNRRRLGALTVAVILSTLTLTCGL